MVSALIHMMTRPAAEKESSKMIFAESLPTTVKIFVQHHFPGRCIALVEKKTTSDGVMYMTTLNDGVQIEFSENGSWEMVDSKMGAMPATLVPDNVAAFMNAYYPSIPLVKIEKKGNGFVVTLSNYVSLRFDQIDKVA